MNLSVDSQMEFITTLPFKKFSFDNQILRKFLGCGEFHYHFMTLCLSDAGEALRSTMNREEPGLVAFFNVVNILPNFTYWVFSGVWQLPFA